MAPAWVLTTSPGRYPGEGNGWVVAQISKVIVAFGKSVIQYPNMQRYVGGASTDLIGNLQRPDNPVPLLKQQIENRMYKAAAEGPRLHDDKAAASAVPMPSSATGTGRRREAIPHPDEE